MNSFFNRFAEFPKRHKDITSLKSNTVDLPTPMLVLCGTTGTISAVDENDVAITYTIDAANSILPIVVKRINSTGTNVTQIIGLY